MKRVETVMTYEEWCKAHRKTLKKMAKNSMQWLIFIVMFAGLPVGMFAHWLIIGY